MRSEPPTPTTCRRRCAPPPLDGHGPGRASSSSWARPAGLRLALQAVRAGYLVIGLDHDTRRIGRLSHGRSDLDPATDAALAAALRGRYVPTADRRFAEGFDTAVVVVADGPASVPADFPGPRPHDRWPRSRRSRGPERP